MYIYCEDSLGNHSRYQKQPIPGNLHFKTATVSPKLDKKQLSMSEADLRGLTHRQSEMKQCTILRHGKINPTPKNEKPLIHW